MNRTSILSPSVAVAVACLLSIASCAPGDKAYAFAVSVDNQSGADLRLRVFVPRLGPQLEFDILIRAHSPRRDGPVDVMAADEDGSAQPVLISMYTSDCEPLVNFEIGEGRTLVTILPDFIVETEPLADITSMAPGVEWVPVC